MSKPGNSATLLERFTGVVLTLMLLAIGWMVLVTLIPALPRMLSVEAEVIVMIGLLTASLVLVSVVALLHTRR